MSTREEAQEALTAAQAALTDAKKAVEQAKADKAAAQAILDAARPNIMLAEANVMTAKANLLKFGPLPSSGGNNSDILPRVLAALQGAGHEMTVDEIHAAIGATTSRDNLAAYLARWNKSGAVLKAEKINRLDPAKFYAPAAAPAVPSVFGGVAAPAGFPEDFPGREALVEAGYTSPADLAGKTNDELLAIPGVGKATAGKILAVV